jgi:predicted Zn-dependent protease
MRNIVSLLALIALVGSAFAQPPKKPAAPPAEDPEVKMGREAHEELLKSGIKLINDPALLGRVNTIGQKMAGLANTTVIPATYGTPNTKPLVYRFFVVDDPDINAFALPGGYIYIHKALLNYVESDDELAGVLGHEIMHAAHSHVVRLQKEQGRLNTQMALAALATMLARVPATDAGNVLMGVQLLALQKVSGYSQNAEKDADNGGVILAQKAGYNPVGALTFMERLARDQRRRPDIELGIYRTHPPEQDRADTIVAQIKGMGLPINRRQTTKILKVTTRVLNSLHEVQVDGQTLYKDASAEKAKEAASLLDRVLDTDPQVYELSQKGAAVFLRGEAILNFTTTADADSAFKTLRNILYRNGLRNGI